MAKRRKGAAAIEQVQEETQAQEASERNDDDIALDFGAAAASVKKTFSRMRIDGERAGMIGLLLLAILIVFWIRMLPLSLPVTDAWAENSIRTNLNNQFATQIAQQYPALPQANRDELVNQKVEEFIAQNSVEYDAAKEQLSEGLKQQLQYLDGDGDAHVYLGDLDSYFWLRYARNWLNTGMTCDIKTAEGECRDTFILAPVGVPSSTNPALHVFGIAGLHMLFTAFDPHFPLPATALWMQVIFGVIAVIPAFFLGRRLAGNVGGFTAAIITALHPMHLSRTLGNDNDTWNIFMPLLVAWMIVEALESKTWKRTAIFSAAAAIFVGVHAAAWAGWWFGYLVILLGLICLVLYRIVRDLVRGERSPWNDKSVQLSLIALGVFYVVTLFAALPTMSVGNYLQTPLNAVHASSNLAEAVANEYWPNVLTTVAELNSADFTAAVNNFGGKLFFLGGLIGMLLMLLPRKGWRLSHWLTLAGGIALYGYLVSATGMTKITILALLGVPIAAALLNDLIYGLSKDDEAHLGASILILIWFAASVYATYNGVRFILLLIPAFGVAFGVLTGRIYTWGTSVLRKEFPKHEFLVGLCVFAVICLTLLAPIKTGYATAQGYVPSIDDAWWDALTKIRMETAPDAIINSWWDFGHWFKYVAERRVSADGTTQHTHVPHWLGKALVTSSDDEAAGILRMLDCGSDAYPAAEGAQGAYGITFAAVKDPIIAQDLVAQAVKVDKVRARAIFAKAGIDEATVERILEKTHCQPPEDYLITSGDMVGKAGVWAHFGLWDFKRAYAVDQTRTQTQDVAVPNIAKTLNISTDAARQMYAEIQGLRNIDGSWSEGGINQYVAPWPGYLTGSWVACQDTANGTALVCPGPVGINQNAGQTIAIDGLLYNKTDPTRSQVALGAYVNGQRTGGQDNATVEAIIVADDRLRKLSYTEPAISGIAIVIDVPNKRMLVASTPLAESLFTQLFYLDGRYTTIFKKFDDRTSFTGSRITVWKVDWEELDRQQAMRADAAR